MARVLAQRVMLVTLQLTIHTIIAAVFSAEFSSTSCEGDLSSQRSYLLALY